MHVINDILPIFGTSNDMDRESMLKSVLKSTSYYIWESETLYTSKIRNVMKRIAKGKSVAHIPAPADIIPMIKKQRKLRNPFMKMSNEKILLQYIEESSKVVGAYTPLSEEHPFKPFYM